MIVVALLSKAKVLCEDGDDDDDNYVLFFALSCLMNNSHVLLFSAFQTNDSACWSNEHLEVKLITYP